MTHNNPNRPYQSATHIAMRLDRSDEPNHEDGMVDLLTDAMHWCDVTGRDFHILFARAASHYLAELNSEPTDQRRRR
jgi:hypothetical protein